MATTYILRCLTLFLLVAVMATPALAQPALTREQQREERDALQESDRHIRFEEYRQAIPFLERALRVNPNNALGQYQLGWCYMNIGLKHKAYPHLKKAIELNPNVDPRLRGLWARALHYNGEIDKALAAYREYLLVLQRNDPERPIIERRIQQCNNAKVLMRDTLNVLIENLGPAVNSAYPDYVPVISADEEVLIFTSRRPENIGQEDLDGFKFEDVYISRRTNGQWGRAQNIGSPINTEFHDATSSLSPDGQTLFIYRDASRDVYECRLRGEAWGAPADLGRRVMGRNSWDEHACLSPDGRNMYFTSDREGGLGGLDVWMSTKQPNGEWGDPVNLGPNVNTPLDERGPFMHVDGVTLYFSSEGHNSMGGLDIFKTVRTATGTWGVPQNIGFPVNTPDDDVYFVMAANGQRAYYSSSREGSLGEKDIYVILFRRDANPALATQEVQPDRVTPTMELNLASAPANSVTILKGLITNAETGAFVEATIRVVHTGRNEEMSFTESNSASGRYLSTLPSGGQYAIFVEAEGYLFHSEHFDIPQEMGFQEVIRDIQLKPIKRGATIVLRNIFFDHDRATLRDESQAELQELIKTLRENPTLNIRINGHTDSNGDDAYNLDLSRRRAKAVVTYLVEHGIPQTRLQSEGFGEGKPIDTNETDAGRQNNRRTEFEIISF